MPCQDNIIDERQWMSRREGLVFKDVERGAADPAVHEGIDQSILIYHWPA